MRLNAVFPNFQADTTQGPIDFYQWLGDSWAVVFSHPADFTPVCTTELGRIAVHANEFKKRNVKLLSISCDKLQSHKDWVADIKSYCLDIPGEFPYPIIADEKRELAVKLDMLDEEQKDDTEAGLTVRALYIVGPDKKLKLSMVYPFSTGRNVDEILRVIDSLQVTANKQVATPANWKPGDKVMVLPSVKKEDLPKLFPKGVDTVKMPSGIEYVRMTNDY
ncbi:peroxiredoxin-6-like [Ischnura elegans]|uniref:peroxiredoxin-6-like n=1 Tax=Ischnura elegans TaxID=197161 RepID=UPI001ED8908B|nr:peroxiredoxin-6-like [Ischnura elegans]